MHFSYAAVAVLVFPSIANAFGAAQFKSAQLRESHSTSSAEPPSTDPFYVPPKGYADSSEPGDILRHRQITPPVGGGAYTFQLLFRSTDSNGDPSAVVTTILAPAFGDTKKLVSVQIPYDSCDVDCSPSYTQQTGGNGTADAFIASALSSGYFVNVPDYEGHLASFTNGVQSGQATLDSVRAALKSTKITGLEADAKYALAGYSGGALASEWAAELQPCYAPELVFVGAALGGLTPNTTNVLFTINKTPFAGLAPAGLIGITSQNEKFSNYVQSKLIPSKKAAFDKVKTECLTTAIVAFANKDIGSYFSNGLETLTLPNVTKFVDTYGIMGRRATPSIPLYVYKGVKDQISPVADTDKLVAKYCSRGARITYVRDSAEDHLGEESAGEPDAYSWIVDRLNGVKVSYDCNVTTI